MAIGLGAALPSLAAEDPPKPFKELLSELLPGIAAEKNADREKPQQQLQEACFQLGTPGREAERAEACRLMGAQLGPLQPKPARLWLLKQLQFLGRAECVPVVALLLGDRDAELRDAALRALQSNPAIEANAALVAALDRTTDAQPRVALLDALAYRADAASLPAAAKALGDSDAAVASAAANALGRIGNGDADKALAAAQAKAPAALRPRLAEARLRCADKLLAAGQAAAAAALYAALDAADQPRPVRLAAKRGILNAAGEKAPTEIVRLLVSDDTDAQQIAAGAVADLSGPHAMDALAAALPKLPPRAQVLLLGALAAKGDKAALPIALAAVKGNDPQVQAVALRSLGKLGDESVVKMLIQRAAAGGDLAVPAREALGLVWGNGVDQTLAAALKAEDAAVRNLLLDVVEDRGTAAAAPTLVQFAQGADTALRDRALRALGKLAEPEHLPAMIEVTLKTAKGRARDDAEKAVMLACNRCGEEDERAAPVLAAMAAASAEQRLALLPLAGRIGGAKALEAVRAALGSNDEPLREAGVRALCNWPDVAVADELLRLAQSSDVPAHRIAALRAYVRVIGLKSNRSPKQTLALFQKAMEMATRDDERNLVLGRAAEARAVETLRWVLPYLDRPELAREASRTIVDLAHRKELRDPHRAEFDAALKKVVEVCKDQGLVEQAKRQLAGL